MAIPANCIHWTKAGSDAECTVPEKGQAWTVNGSPAYTACKFNAGVDCTAATKYLSMADFDNLNKNSGGIEFWFKPHYNRVGEGSRHGIIQITNWTDLRFQINYDQNRDSIYFLIQDTVAGRCNPEDTTAFSAEQLFHLAFIWDINGSLAGGKRAAIYRDGVDNSAIVTVNNAWTSDFPATCPFYVGRNPAYGDSGDHIIDNLKIWNNHTDAIASLANRNTEDFPSVGGGRLIDQKMIAPLIDGNLMVS